jgi:hypothetical protein
MGEYKLINSVLGDITVELLASIQLLSSDLVIRQPNVDPEIKLILEEFLKENDFDSKINYIEVQSRDTFKLEKEINALKKQLDDTLKTVLRIKKTLLKLKELRETSKIKRNIAEVDMLIKNNDDKGYAEQLMQGLRKTSEILKSHYRLEGLDDGGLSAVITSLPENIKSLDIFKNIEENFITNKDKLSNSSFVSRQKVYVGFCDNYVKRIEIFYLLNRITFNYIDHKFNIIHVVPSQIENHILKYDSARNILLYSLTTDKHVLNTYYKTNYTSFPAIMTTILKHHLLTSIYNLAHSNVLDDFKLFMSNYLRVMNDKAEFFNLNSQTGIVGGLMDAIKALAHELNQEGKVNEREILKRLKELEERIGIFENNIPILNSVGDCKFLGSQEERRQVYIKLF